jgi:hypothetical protein
MKAYRRSGGTALLKTNIGTRYRCAVNFTLRPFYLRERTPAQAVLKYQAKVVGRRGDGSASKPKLYITGTQKNNYSGGRAFHACASVTDAPSSFARLWEIRENGQPTNSFLEIKI